MTRRKWMVLALLVVALIIPLIVVTVASAFTNPGSVGSLHCYWSWGGLYCDWY